MALAIRVSCAVYGTGKVDGQLRGLCQRQMWAGWAVYVVYEVYACNQALGHTLFPIAPKIAYLFVSGCLYEEVMRNTTICTNDVPEVRDLLCGCSLHLNYVIWLYNIT